MAAQNHRLMRNEIVAFCVGCSFFFRQIFCERAVKSHRMRLDAILKKYGDKNSAMSEMGLT
jgi:uncharacterized protein YcsI (UPF0317 family)